MEEKVERPSYYMYRTGIVSTPGKCNMSLPYNWRGNTVATIIQKREYMGDLVNFKTHKPSFKSKKQVLADKFLELVHRYTVFDELTTPMLHEFYECLFREIGKGIFYVKGGKIL